MAIEITSGSQCDATGCRTTLHIDDSCYCESCYQELLDKITKLEKEIEDLNQANVADEENEPAGGARIAGAK